MRYLVRNPFRASQQVPNPQSLLADFLGDFSDVWGRSALPALSADFVPKINVSETEKEYKVAIELPGVEEKDIEVTLEENVLRIKGERKSEFQKSEEHYHRYESTYGSFERAFQLPEAINFDESKATFKNGVLNLEIPKTKESAKVKKLKINS